MKNMKILNITMREIKDIDDAIQTAIEGDYILFFEHDPVYDCCNLQQTERGIRPGDFFKLEEV